MKKILLFAAAALVASSASANWVSIIEGGKAADGETASLQAGWAGPAQVVDNPKGDGKVFECPIAANPENTWDSQFFVVFNEPLQSGDVYKVSFDYLCSDDRSIELQAQGEKGDYHLWNIGMNGGAPVTGFDAKTEWQSFSYSDITVDDEMAKNGGFKTIAFNLATASAAATFYINNVVVEKQVEEGGETPEEPAGNTLDVLPNLSNEAYDADTKTITFGAEWGWVNWWYGEGNFSEYDNFVLEFEPVSYIVQIMVLYNDADSQTVQAQPGENKIVVPLDPEHKNSIQQIAIQNSEPGTLTLKAAYFEAAAGVHSISAAAVRNGVYNLQGVKVADSLDEVAAPGLYISNGKKVIKK